MRPVDDLIDLADPGWPLVEEWIGQATNSVEVLPGDAARGREVLGLLQVTTRSPMGAIAYQSGGLLVDGWLRILGGGGKRMTGDLANWNGLGSDPQFHVEGALIVALDPVGGVFAIDQLGQAPRQSLGAADSPRFARLADPETRNVAYFSPDSLDWQDLEVGYSDFLQSMFRSDLDEFFSGLRWDGWREQLAAASLDDGVSIWPPLWSHESREGDPSRKIVPLREVVGVGFDMARQISDT
jgi:hypothetical protein